MPYLASPCFYKLDRYYSCTYIKKISPKTVVKGLFRTRSGLCDWKCVTRISESLNNCTLTH